MLGVCLALINEPSDKDKFKHLYYTYNEMMFKIAMHRSAHTLYVLDICLLKFNKLIKINC